MAGYGQRSTGGYTPPSRGYSLLGNYNYTPRPYAQPSSLSALFAYRGQQRPQSAPFTPTPSSGGGGSPGFLPPQALPPLPQQPFIPPPPPQYSATVIGTPSFGPIAPGTIPWSFQESYPELRPYTWPRSRNDGSFGMI